nr:RnfABCDGE type electron transport complex subunit G [Candidatus Omnitrophota bacterium]
MKTILKFAFILFLVNLIAASILAATYGFTKVRIQKQQDAIKEDALKQVMPETVGDRIEPVKKDGIIKYWKVFKGQGTNVAGYIFASKKYGYSSVIETMVGMKKDGTITGVRVLSQNETPGLGAKIVEIISNKTLSSSLKEAFSKEKPAKVVISPYFTEQFKDKDIRGIELSKNNIHAITGATISSKAVLNSIKSMGVDLLNNKDE